MKYGLVFSRKRIRKWISFSVVLSSLAFSFSVTSAQQRSSSRPLEERDVDVIRINSDLVQTDVVVLDRQGRFVDGLKSSEFELRVDEKPQLISFFEQIMTGSSAEEKRLAIIRGKLDTASILETPAGITEHRRTMIFFI